MFRIASSLLPERAVQNLTGIYFTAQHWATVGRGKLHSKEVKVDYPNMKIQILPALSDNYMYLITDEQTGEAAIVDPVKPDTVLAAVKEAKVNLTTVLTTHHHWDHAGGNEELVQKVSDLKVYGGDERIGALNRKVKQGDTLTVGNLIISCLATPCHTTGHICYYIAPQPGSDQRSAVFTGDTLFLGGCGKFFEGTAEQMYEALIKKLSPLPDNTDVYCGHEYATSNLKFGVFIEPENKACQEKLAWVIQRREEGLPSVPSTIGEEKAYNPFMRVDLESVQKIRKTTTGEDTMRSIRTEKDNWRP